MDRSREHTAAFTGHRRYDGECDDALRAVVRELYGRGFRVFWSGMALGFDLAAAEAVLALRAERGGVTLEAAVPCLDQDRFWPERAQARYRYLLSRCDTRTVLEHSYSPGCMERRNRYMVDRSSVLVAVYNGGSGGTLNTIRYARSRGLTVLQLTY